MLRTIYSGFSFLARHLAALLVSITVPTVLYLAFWVVCFLYAAFTNQDLGSPMLSFILAVAVIAVACIYSLLILFPSVALSEYLSCFCGKWSHLAQIPIAVTVMAAIIYVLHFALTLINLNKESSIFAIINYPFAVILVLLLPLGLYWVSMKFTQLVFAFPLYIYKVIRSFRSNPQEVRPTSGKRGEGTGNEEGV